MKSFNILFEPFGRKGSCPSDTSIAEYARQMGIGIASICGGHGTCGNCRMQIITGAPSKPTESELKILTGEQIRAGWRLACQVFPTSDLKIHIPAESMTTSQRIQLEGLETPVQPDPAVSVYVIKLKEPSLEDSQADADRLLKSVNRKYRISCNTIDFGALCELSPVIRSQQWMCNVAVRNDEIISIMPMQSEGLGLAIDLGTTKIAAYLINLANGKTLAAAGIMNPQIDYGEDVITRINRVVRSAEQSINLQQLVVKAFNQVTSDLSKQVGATSKHIVDMVVVGNTAMHHLFLGLPVFQLARAPFISSANISLDVKARDLGLNIASGAFVHLLPNIAGFVGGDHVAALMATGITQTKGISILIDIGTNTEISLAKNGKISSLSCASGPAFEGGHIKDGMRAAAGAIEGVRIINGEVSYKTVDDSLAIGICGSGLVDAIAQMYLAGIVDAGGKIQPGSHGVRKNDNHLEYLIAKKNRKSIRPAVTIAQHDIRELQLAKSAIRSGIQVLLENSECTEEQVDKIIIAGAFGTYIDISSAITLGMFPAFPLERFVQVGNAAGMGAKLALISKHKRQEADKIAVMTNYIELAGVPNFNKTFIQANYLGRYYLVNGERREIK